MPWPMERPKGRALVWDIETNGLLKATSDGHPPMDRIHCGTTTDLDTLEKFHWTPDTIKLMPEFLMDEAGTLLGHNIVNFDTRATSRIYPKFDREKFLLLDTLILAKMIWPADALIGPDMKRWRAGRMPAKYLKRQSLGAWGYRLGNYKGEYDGGWMEWSQEMQDYMIQDVAVNLDLWKLIERRLGWNGQPLSSSSGSPSPDASPLTPGSATAAANPSTYVWPYLPIWIDTEMQKVVDAQEDRGVWFDKAAAEALTTELRNQQAAMADDLRKVFGAWWQPKDDPTKGRKNNRDRTRVCREHPDITVPRFGKTGKPLKAYVGPPKEHYFAGSPFVRIEWTEFNPNSRTHLADRLQRVFGWKPDTFTASGKAQVDESVIKALPSSVIDDATRQVIMDYFVTTKTLGMLAEGNKSWLHFVGDDSRIHGRVDPLGTVTGRGAHYNPNLGQIMSVKVAEQKDATGKVIAKKPIMGLKGGYGLEARGLFGADPESDMPELTGSDMSSLEFVLLGHDLWPYDNGEFSRRACDPEADLHQDHASRANLSRAHAKTLGYLIIYGGGAWKAGSGMGVEEHEIGQLLRDKGLPGRLRFMRKILGADYVEPNDLDKARIVKGAQGIKSIKDAIPGLADLITSIKDAAEERGYVKAIDGRKLFVRKPHAALNTRLQGSGAVACKLWIVLFHKKMRENGYVPGIHYNQVLWVHDEVQIEHQRSLGAVIAEVSEEAAKEAGRALKLRGEFRTESKTGKDWACTH